MSDDDDDVEWEYEDESDAHEEAEASPPRGKDVEGVAELVGSPAQADDDGDVDWEDATEPQAEPTWSQEPPVDDDDHGDVDDEQHDADTAVVDDLNAVNWDHINSVLQRQAEKESKTEDQKPKRKVVRMTKLDKEHELALHKSHLLLLLARLRRVNALCQSRVLRGLLLSLTSDSSVDFYKKLDEMQLKYALEMLVRWFHQHFQLPDDDRSTDTADSIHVSSTGEISGGLTDAGLLCAVFNRRGRHAELVLLFTALCRALGLRTRLTQALDAVAVQQRAKAADAATTAASTPRGAARKRRRRVPEAEATKESEEPTTGSMQWIWCEVWDSKANTWVTVDPMRKIVSRPHDICQARGATSPLSYIVSSEDDGFLMDVSPRYVERWSKTMPHRLAHDWLIRSLQLLNAVISSTEIDPADQQRRESERAKLQQMTESEEMPTSFEAFKKHHLYCLERHLTQAECIHPKKAVGLFKGHAVYLRKNVQATRAWYQWRRLGREVRESERDRPAKRQGGTKPTAKSSSASGSDEEEDCGDDHNPGAEREKRALYGYWQTDEVVVPSVDGVTVPKNKFGNIELWSPAHLPAGAVHLVLPRIEKVAQQLGVDFAPALVGFESRDGRNVPTFEGIVVAAVVADTLLDAHAHFQHSNIEKAIEKNQQIIVRRWEKLMKRVLLKLRLNEEYGEV